MRVIGYEFRLEIIFSQNNLLYFKHFILRLYFWKMFVSKNTALQKYFSRIIVIIN